MVVFLLYLIIFVEYLLSRDKFTVHRVPSPDPGRVTENTKVSIGETNKLG